MGPGVDWVGRPCLRTLGGTEISEPISAARYGNLGTTPPFNLSMIMRTIRVHNVAGREHSGPEEAVHSVRSVVTADYSWGQSIAGVEWNDQNLRLITSHDVVQLAASPQGVVVASDGRTAPDQWANGSREDVLLFWDRGCVQHEWSRTTLAANLLRGQIMRIVLSDGLAYVDFEGCKLASLMCSVLRANDDGRLILFWHEDE